MGTETPGSNMGMKRYGFDWSPSSRAMPPPATNSEVGDRMKVDPAVIGPIARRPHHGSDPGGGEIEVAHRRGRDARRFEPLGRSDLVVETQRRRGAVERLQKPAELEVGEGADVGERAGELGDAVVDAPEPADDTDAGDAQRIEVDRASPRRTDQLW